MPLFTMFKKTPPIDGRKMLDEIGKWLTITLNPRDVDTRQWTAHMERQSFLEALPGARKFLEQLREDVSKAINLPEKEKKPKLSDAQQYFQSIKALANEYRTIKGDLAQLDRFKKTHGSDNQIDPNLQALYTRFEKLTGYPPIVAMTPQPKNQHRY